jgi:3-dehydroquinate dehydratase/shikimate dehydrogenase
VNKGKICVSVCSESVTGTIANIKRAEKIADVIEVRFDCLSKHVFNIEASVETGAMAYLCWTWENILCATRKPIISTYRPAVQGGRQELTTRARGIFWYAGMATEFCDVEEDLFDDASSQFFQKRILSYHNFEDVPADLNSTFDRLAAQSMADIIKIAVTAHDIAEALPVWKLINQARNAGKEIIPIAMGEAGKWTRVLGLAHGAFMTYASLNEGLETADGQITVKDLTEVYRVKELNKDTAVYGVIGDPVSSSKSPYMHNAAFAASGINAVFLPLVVKNLDEFIARMVAPSTREVELNFAGFSVTMPHKQTIIKHLDEIDAVAAKIGAVNTVKIENGKLVGHNTDAHGFVTPLKTKFGDLKNARVAVLGAGGAARACVFALKQENADVTVFARDIQKANAFADEFGVRSKQLTTGLRPLTTDVDIVVNATSLGMKGPLENESPFTASQLDGVKFVYDLVTRQNDSPIIREAKKAGIPTIGGVEMLIAQGAKQFEIWTGQTAPVEKMLESVLARIQ